MFLEKHRRSILSLEKQIYNTWKKGEPFIVHSKILLLEMVHELREKVISTKCGFHNDNYSLTWVPCTLLCGPWSHFRKIKQYIQKYELTLKYNKFIWVYQNNVLQLLTEGTLSETSPVLTEQKQLAGNKPF